jgi:hypothetical protein
MKLIESKTLGSAQASIEFTSIPQDGTDLLIVISARSSTLASPETRLALNGSTSGFSRRDLRGNGSGTPASSAGSDNYLGEMNPSTYTSNTFSSMSLYIPNYTSSQNKSYSVEIVTENNSTDAQQRILAGLWSNTAAITSLTISAASGDTMVAGSIISLYKITKGFDGIVTTSP